MTNEQDLPDEQPLELLTVSNDPTEAKMIEEMLQNNEIDCMLQGDVNAILPAGALDDIQIYVKPGDLEKAQELIEAYFPGEESTESGDELRADDPDNSAV
jgi:Putative prokaryotic signal transducing protein